MRGDRRTATGPRVARGAYAGAGEFRTPAGSAPGLKDVSAGRWNRSLGALPFDQQLLFGRTLAYMVQESMMALSGMVGSSRPGLPTLDVDVERMFHVSPDDEPKPDCKRGPVPLAMSRPAPPESC